MSEKLYTEKQMRELAENIRCWDQWEEKSFEDELDCYLDALPTVQAPVVPGGLVEKIEYLLHNGAGLYQHIGSSGILAVAQHLAKGLESDVQAPVVPSVPGVDIHYFLSTLTNYLERNKSDGVANALLFNVELINDHLLAHTPQEQKPVVLSVEELEAMTNKWYWECRDRSHMNSPAKAKHEAMVKLHTYILAHSYREPVEVVHDRKAIETAVDELALAMSTPPPSDQVREAVDECGWTRDEWSESWSAGCGAEWIFPDGGPAENDMKFCPSCGKPVAIATLAALTQADKGGV